MPLTGRVLISWQEQQRIRDRAEQYRYTGVAATNQIILRLLAHIQTLDMALQSLTPGGSEYVNNPERVVALVKEQKLELHKARCELARLAKGRT